MDPISKYTQSSLETSRIRSGSSMLSIGAPLKPPQKKKTIDEEKRNKIRRRKKKISLPLFNSAIVKM
jgi:hypothetical protein